MSRPLRVGISTCPNDTFAFHALLEGVIDDPELELDFVLADVEELNQRMSRGELDCAKTSFHAMLALSQRVWVLPAGSALGFGVGPLLLAAPGRPTAPELPAGSHVLTPGASTTATLLLRLFQPAALRLEHTVFSAILPRLERGQADYGACIHEARFTWHQHGVGLVADLGALWEQHTSCPLPLGGLCIARSAGREAAQRLARLVRRSIEWGLAHRAECLPTMRQHAQEQSDEVLWAHVDLYVNDWSLELGPVGREALAVLARLAGENGIARGSALVVL